MGWPLSQDYNEAVQNPARSFSDPDLCQGKAVVNALGIPMPCSGNFADVYQVRCPDGSRWAVKCFTRETPGLRERYQEITRHLILAKLPFMVDFSYLDPGIRVAGKWYPVLKMQWVEGLTLNQFVAQNLDKPAALDALLQVWPRMAKALRAAQVGHCDLQHGNVLLVPGANNALSLKLIDYDGMWVPGLAGTKSGEIGHASYQHPQRQREGTYNLDVDRFSLLLIATALSALKTGGRALWEKYDDGDNLLFRQPDLEVPNKSALFYDLLKLEDRSTHLLTEKLIDAIRRPLQQTPLLEELTSGAHIASVNRDAGRSSPVATQAPVVRQVATAAPAVPAVAVATSPASAAFASFEPSSERKPRRKSNSVVWLALAGALSLGTVAALGILVVVIVLFVNRPADSPQGSLVARKEANADKPKPKDTNADKSPTNPPDKPLPPDPLPRLIASPPLVLLPRGTSDLEVKVDRQGYAGSIKLRFENLPPGVTCLREAVIPAGKSHVWIEFRTDGTAAEGNPTVEVIARTDAQAADRMNVTLLVPKAMSMEPKSETSTAVELLEDDVGPLLRQFRSEGIGKATREAKDKYSGVCSIRVTPSQSFCLKLQGWNFRITENPKDQEYRYIRFAWKKAGGNTIMLQFIGDPDGKTINRYVAGVQPRQWLSLKIAEKLPTEWEVVTRDLFKDFGPFVLTGISLGPLDGQYGLFDHIYLGRTIEDLDKVSAPVMVTVHPSGNNEGQGWPVR